MTVEEAEKVLRENFAPWVLDLGLRVEEVGEGTARLRLPWSGRLAREGGGLSGQALMAAADTATVLAVAGARGGFVPMTTVQLQTTFQRAVRDADVLVDVRLTKLGRTLAFADVAMAADGRPDDLVAHATAVYAILGG
ncbi:PaaI family thioesterase [Actinomadura logoneensis]|uniref:PaaI family thioesterase n=1 Tax=Actinomadura logoneensis TaxID=2293572 RepID=A0A372JME4_9ACTN|nr:PaaI family thioesterase [Actinomadura logoneensis]RFU41185.1 PaaI family thioesterase [Actinomadura logoneensis]